MMLETRTVIPPSEAAHSSQMPQGVPLFQPTWHKARPAAEHERVKRWRSARLGHQLHYFTVPPFVRHFAARAGRRIGSPL